MKTFVRVSNLVFHYFFVARIAVALLAWLFGLENGPGRWWMGPGYWMALLMGYVYLPICVFFIAYNVFLLFRKPYRQRLNAINWVLFFVAIAAEVIYLRADLSEMSTPPPGSGPGL